jgi:type VI protein secretion system component VasK
VITIDGLMAGVEPRGQVRAGFTWPGPYPGRTEAAFDLRYFEPPIRYPGPWSVFRLIDATIDGAPDAQQAVRLKVQTASNHRVSLKIEAARAGLNPFASRAWRQFNCEL